MILCGFWNSEYGDEFIGSNRMQSAAAYHGPPRIDAKRLQTILGASPSPHFVASLLKAEVLRSEPAPKFNHQNAWSYAEFISLAAAHGLGHVPCDDVCAEFADIPTIEDMKNISQYYVFKKST